MYILWVFRFHNFISKMSQESQVNLNFAIYDRLGLRLFTISIFLQSEEKQVWPVGCLRAGCKLGQYQKWQRRLILKNQTVCWGQMCNLKFKSWRKFAWICLIRSKMTSKDWILKVTRLKNISVLAAGYDVPKYSRIFWNFAEHSGMFLNILKYSLIFWNFSEYFIIFLNIL